MKGSALLFMLISWSLIVSLVTFCFTLLLFKGQGTKVKEEREEEENFEEIT